MMAIERGNVACASHRSVSCMVAVMNQRQSLRLVALPSIILDAVRGKAWLPWDGTDTQVAPGVKHTPVSVCTFVAVVHARARVSSGVLVDLTTTTGEALVDSSVTRRGHVRVVSGGTVAGWLVGSVSVVTLVLGTALVPVGVPQARVATRGVQATLAVTLSVTVGSTGGARRGAIRPGGGVIGARGGPAVGPGSGCAASRVVGSLGRVVVAVAVVSLPSSGSVTPVTTVLVHGCASAWGVALIEVIVDAVQPGACKVIA